MKKAGIASKELVDIVSEYEGTVREAKSFHALPYYIPPGCVATYFPEANVLVPIGLTAEKSNTPVSKSVRVKILGTQKSKAS
jgi:anaerobic selenocysteine-containing dehydrogenase